MSLRFASLGSGSSGNATIIAYEQQALLIDCGFSVKETERRLQALDFDPNQLAGILLTHEHGDHAKGVKALARKYAIPVFMSKGTAIAGGFSALSDLRFVSSEHDFNIGAFQVSAITVPHDAREPLQFVVRAVNASVGVLTDLGSFTPLVLSLYSECEALLIEANHDLHMLANGPYPPSLRHRVGGAWGHLNNMQTAELLRGLDLSQTQQLVIGHISEKNNSLACVKDALAEFLHSEMNVTFASQDQGFGWVDVINSAQLVEAP